MLFSHYDLSVVTTWVPVRVCVCVSIYVLKFSNSTFKCDTLSHFVRVLFSNCLCIFPFLFSNRRKLLRHIFHFWNDLAVLFSHLAYKAHIILFTKTMNRINGFVMHSIESMQNAFVHPLLRFSPVIWNIFNSNCHSSLNANDYRLVGGVGGLPTLFMRAPFKCIDVKTKSKTTNYYQLQRKLEEELLHSNNWVSWKKGFWKRLCLAWNIVFLSFYAIVEMLSNALCLSILCIMYLVLVSLICGSFRSQFITFPNKNNCRTK